MKNQEPNNSPQEKKKKTNSRSKSLVYWFVIIVNFGLVLPLSSLPNKWQHQIIILIIGIFSTLNLLLWYKKNVIPTAFYNHVLAWVFFAVSTMFVSTTGLLQSDYFFLFYLVLIVASFVLSFPAAIYIIVLLTLKLALHLPLLHSEFWSSGEYLPAMAKIGSLLAMSPLVLFLANKFGKTEEQSDRLTITQQLLRMYQEEDAAMLDAITAGVIILDHNLQIVECSQPASTMLRLPAVELLNQKISDVLQISDAEHTQVEIGKGILLSALYEHEPTSGQICSLQSKAGPKFKINLTVRPIIGQADHAIGAIVIFEDAKSRTVFDQNHPGAP